MNDSLSDNRRDRPQFSLRWLLVVTAGAGAYVALAVAVVGSGGEILDVVTSAAGVSALGCGVLGLAGLCLMAVNLALGRAGYVWPVGLLLAGLAYAPANVVVFIVTLLVDRSAIFDDAYMISAVFIGPAVMLAALAVVAGFFKPLGWLGVAGFILWIESIAFAHLWIIAAASASV